MRRAVESEQSLPRGDGPVVHEPQLAVPVLLEQPIRLAGIHVAAHEVRDLPVEVPRRVVLEPPRIGVEQKPRRARLLDQLVHRLAVDRLQAAREVRLVSVDDDAAADLVDVRGLPEQSRVLHHLRLAATRLDNHLGARSMTDLERPCRQHGEIAVRVAEHGGVSAEQSAV